MFPGALLQLKGSKGYRVIFHLFDLFQVIFQPFGFGFEMFFLHVPKQGRHYMSFPWRLVTRILSLLIVEEQIMGTGVKARLGSPQESSYPVNLKNISPATIGHIYFLYVLCIYIYICSVCIYIYIMYKYTYIYVNIYINQHYLSIGL